MNTEWAAEELKRLNHMREVKGQEPLVPCPLCLKPLKVKVVGKDGKNKGRQFVSCEGCEVFEWMDMPQCPGCGRREYEAVCKNGKNCGKTFRSCPGKCSFRWITIT